MSSVRTAAGVWDRSPMPCEVHLSLVAQRLGIPQKPLQPLGRKNAQTVEVAAERCQPGSARVCAQLRTDLGTGALSRHIGSVRRFGQDSRRSHDLGVFI
jgi:hypothetical protein